MTHEATCNAAFRRHHMGRLLHRIGTLLPQWLNGPDLARGCRDLEQLCWRELGSARQPVFGGDLPPFLMVDALVIKICKDHQVRSRRVLLAIGVNQEGYREVLKNSDW